MRTKIKIPQIVDVALVRISIPVSYEEEDIPNNFPLRTGDTWTATVEIDSGRIMVWPSDAGERHLCMKVCDEGTYTLLDRKGEVIAKIDNDYVPHCLIPGEYGDYIDLKINEDGVITNWPKNPSLKAFFNLYEDED